MGVISIIGLGLIGGSMGLALKEAKIPGVTIVGHDKDASAAGKAKRMNAVDKTEWNLIASVEEADMVILAVPVMSIKEIMGQIASYLPEGCVVTDTGSTKAQVMAWAKELLPPTVSFVGGHPMAGKETAGVEAAEVTLFKGCTYCLTPSPDASREALEAVVGTVHLIGAKPYFVDPYEHDGFVGGISHLPFLLSTALVATATSSASWREMSRLAAGGFRDVSRLASGDPQMHRDICLTNQESMARWIDEYIDTLRHFRQLILEGGDGIYQELNKAWEARERWLHRPETTEEERLAPEIPSVKETMASIFLPRQMAHRTERLLRDKEKKVGG